MEPIFDIARVTSVYTGRTGCCCGCRGKHSEHKGTITRVANAILAADPKDVTVHPWGAYIDNGYHTKIVYFDGH